MKKIIIAIGLTLSLAGCAGGWKAEVNTEVRHEQAVYVDVRKQAFIDLVLFVRENRNNTKPSPDLKERLAQKIKAAGMEQKCFPNGKCRLIYGNNLISFDGNIVQIEYSPTSSIKTEDLNKAADAIYDKKKVV